MSSVENSIPDGLCLGFGATNARVAAVRGGEVHDIVSEPTPSNPDEFFGWMARRILKSADAGAEWVVAGFPGPVYPEGGHTYVGPFANIPALSKAAYLLNPELYGADRAYGRLISSGFKLVAVNDGELAAHAVATRFAQPDDRRVGALIVGTGVGFGAAQRGSKNVFTTVTLPLEVGHAPMEDNPLITFETTFSGPALQRTYGQPPEDLPAGHPAWETVGKGIGRVATTVSLLIGLDLVVPTGGLGAGASGRYKRHLKQFMDSYTRFASQTAKNFRPRLEFVDPAEAHTFELHGAASIIRAQQAQA
jgi:predicted NBD/HSP70 family sugar kinase